ncbi:hypothetical protein K0P33_11880 [Pseudomonas sp. ArH3a]|uniref:hypothetical protein n=1 Tax=Pseudomonas sp. ArH3a TaxID=2862945 RepID=UPI002052122A|nr:hypothetical protein K0P33_11880 [Pseudomonas sp. ArH3a]
MSALPFFGSVETTMSPGGAHEAYLGVDRTFLPACTSSMHTIEVIQRYQLNRSHDGAEYNEARTENPLAVG